MVSLRMIIIIKICVKSRVKKFKYFKYFISKIIVVYKFFKRRFLILSVIQGLYFFI